MSSQLNRMLTYQLKKLNKVLEPTGNTLTLSEEKQTKDGEVYRDLSWSRPLNKDFELSEHVYGGDDVEISCILRGIEVGILSQRCDSPEDAFSRLLRSPYTARELLTKLVIQRKFTTIVTEDGVHREIDRIDYLIEPERHGLSVHLRGLDPLFISAEWISQLTSENADVIVHSYTDPAIGYSAQIRFTF